MITTKIIEKKDNPCVDYPKLMKDKQTDSIFYFIKDKYALCVVKGKNSSMSVGQIYTNLDMNYFIDFNDQIVLENIAQYL